MTLKMSHMCEYPMRLGYVPLSARTPCAVRPSTSGTGRVLSVFRPPVAGRLLSARRQRGCYPSPGCLRAVAHRQRRSTDADFTHSGSKELRSIVQTPTHIRGCRFGGPALPPGAGPPNRQGALADIVPRQTYLSGGEGAQKIRPIIGNRARLRKGSTHAQPSPLMTEMPRPAVKDEVPRGCTPAERKVQETGRSASVSGWQISRRLVW